jgi:dTDP-6-deoxy-L-talose 4-dehydrogenase (NAD+)
MRVAITGASGFVGRHVLRELQSRDLDIVATIRSPKRQIVEHPRTTEVVMNIAHDLPDAFTALGKPDVLIHLAWDGLPNYQSSKHVEIELVNQQRFINACLASGLSRLIVTGTCFEYGMVEGQISEVLQANPTTQYGIAKDLLRQHLQELKASHPFQLAWLRLFYLYGPGQSKTSLYSLLTDAIQRHDKSFDMSGGEQVRDFMSIYDAARDIVNISLLSIDLGVVNVCSGVPTTVRELVQRWINEMNSSIAMNLGRIPYSEIEPMSFWGDRSKLGLLLSDN